MGREEFDKAIGMGGEGDNNGESTTAVIDPVKEAKMMRKFDASHESEIELDRSF